MIIAELHLNSNIEIHKFMKVMGLFIEIFHLNSNIEIHKYIKH